MNRQLTVEQIQEKLGSVVNLFDPEKETYKIIFECANNKEMSAEEIMEYLKKIGSIGDYPKQYRQFFFDRFNELTWISGLDKRIRNSQEKIKKEYEEINEEFKKRGLQTVQVPEFVNNKDYEKMSIYQKERLLISLKQELEIAKNTKEQIKKDKELGEEFGIEQDKAYDPDVPEIDKSKEEIKNLNNQAEKNTKIIPNADIDMVSSYYNHFSKNQVPDKRDLDIDINYENGKVKLSIGYVGSEINEETPKMIFTYSGEEAIKYYEDNILPYLAEQHITSSNIKGKENEDGSITYTNSHGESINVNGDNVKTEETKDYLDSKAKERGRQRTLDDKGYNKKAVFIILFWMIIIGVITYLLLKFLM